MKKLFGFFLFNSTFLVACSPGAHQVSQETTSTDSDRSFTDSVIASDIKSKAAGVIPKGWEYSRNKNEAKGTTALIAKTNAIPHGKQIFPYELFVPSLIMRDDSVGGLDVFITDNDRDFLCNEKDIKFISAYFDDGPEERWKCSAAFGPSSAVFIKDTKRFIAKIQSSRHLIIKADMAGRTKSDYKFDLRELRWPMAPSRTESSQVK